MFTQQEAEKFVDNILNKVRAKGEHDSLERYYTEDFIGHYMDEVYYVKDLKKLGQIISSKLEKLKYDILRVVVIDNLIITTCTIKWIDKASKNSYQIDQVSIWLIRDKKISEAWIISDQGNAVLKRSTVKEFNSWFHFSDMYTTVEAREFFDNLYTDIFTNCQYERLMDYYQPDFIGHNYNEDFNLDDVKDRVTVIEKYYKNVKFAIKNLMVSNELVTLSNRISFELISDGSIYEVVQFATFLIKDKKIQEAWLVHENEPGSYRQFTQYGWQPNSDFLKPFEVLSKNKEEYIKAIQTALELNERRAELPRRELECLYYYLMGYSAKETAIEMKMSPRTVESYILHVKDRFGCNNRLELRKILFPGNEIN